MEVSGVPSVAQEAQRRGREECEERKDLTRSEARKTPGARRMYQITDDCPPHPTLAAVLPSPPLRHSII
ncbi:hypothetical protein E2C01_057828 [Portunus trituberculatus]|uniref:Uncharacterized protein n=1 Tax=Portunus trituberculatus TaxID=210409 RepID=A0A5B7H1J4_PORTR|nr:hypothetical protein [Portunus trituberculatus]